MVHNESGFTTLSPQFFGPLCQKSERMWAVFDKSQRITYKSERSLQADSALRTRGRTITSAAKKPNWHNVRRFEKQSGLTRVALCLRLAVCTLVRRAPSYLTPEGARRFTYMSAVIKKTGPAPGKMS